MTSKLGPQSLLLRNGSKTIFKVLVMKPSINSYGNVNMEIRKTMSHSNIYLNNSEIVKDVVNVVIIKKHGL
jgi:hypothetical protein